MFCVRGLKLEDILLSVEGDLRHVSTKRLQCNVLMTNEMHISYNQFVFHSFFCLLYMFRKNLVVHHQEHGVIYCITQYNRGGESS